MKTILFAVSFFVMVVAAAAQQQLDTTGSPHPKTGRIERVSEKGRKAIRFVDSAGKKLKVIDIEPKELKIRIMKSKAFDPVGFPVPISTQEAEHIKDMRKKSGRDVVFMRRESKGVNISRNGRFVAVEEGISDFTEYVDANDSERADEPYEFKMTTKVYDSEGKKILELQNAEGWQPVISNTGKYFVVTLGEYSDSWIINGDKAVLAKFKGSVGPVFFSETDRYVLVVQFNPNDETGMATLSVFDTKENLFELKRLLLPWSVFASDETPEIDESTRTMIIRHAWDPATKEAKVDKVRF